MTDSGSAAGPAQRTAVGVLLAAGAGQRAGGPKALRVDADGTSWLLRSIAVLRDGGCQDVIIVLGRAADRAQGVLAGSGSAADRHVRVVVEPEWSQGMGISLRAGLRTAAAGPWQVAVVHLVDLPDVTAAVVSRLLQQAGFGASALARASYAGRPGHPVLIGVDHVPAVLAEVSGDRGAREYLVRQGADAVECGDLATGRDSDT